MTTRGRRAPLGYHAHVVDHPELGRRDITLIRNLVRPGARLLDLGCGPGGFIDDCPDEVALTVGLDQDLEALHVATRSGRMVLGDARLCPFSSSSFDAVRAKELIEHLPEPRKMVDEVVRILVPGGLLLAHVPTVFSQLYPVANFWDDYTHVRPFTRFSLRRLLAGCGKSPPGRAT